MGVNHIPTHSALKVKASPSLKKPCLGSQLRVFGCPFFFAYLISRFAVGVGGGPYHMAFGVALLLIKPPSGISSFTNTSAIIMSAEITRTSCG